MLKCGSHDRQAIVSTPHARIALLNLIMILGQIKPIGNPDKFTRKAWCQFISCHADFRRHAPRESRNPFSGKAMHVTTTDDVAEVIAEGRKVGSAWWSMNDEPLVNVEIEPSFIPLAQMWAKELSGEFFPVHET
jgi:hypothetical protein